MQQHPVEHRADNQLIESRNVRPPLQQGIRSIGPRHGVDNKKSNRPPSGPEGGHEVRQHGIRGAIEDHATQHIAMHQLIRFGQLAAQVRELGGLA